jgi:hypothetical protein
VLVRELQDPDAVDGDRRALRGHRGGRSANANRGEREDRGACGSKDAQLRCDRLDYGFSENGG